MKPHLVTGARRGLGYAMHRELGGVPFTRATMLDCLAPPYGAIIHCAASPPPTDLHGNVYGFVQDNLLLTQRLLEIPHDRFVYVSSIDVQIPERAGLYASAKLFCEALVRAEGKRPLILRPTSLLGFPMRPSSIFRMLTEPDCSLFLAPQSRFNFVLHRDVCAFVEAAIDGGVEGTFAIGSSASAGLGEIARRLELTPRFGRYTYDVGAVDQAKAAHIVPALRRSSWETLEVFIEQLGDRYIGRQP